MPIMTLVLRIQWWGQIYVIIEIHTYTLKKLWHCQTNQPQLHELIININKKVIFKKCVPFTNCMREIHNTQVDDAQDIDLVMSMCNSIEYSDVYSKTSVTTTLYR